MTNHKGDIDKNNEKYRNYLAKKAALVKIAAFLACIVAGAVISLIIPLRPAESEMEKRTLAKYPEYDWNSFFNGEYFSEVDTWFSDTFPGRDSLMMFSEKLTGIYGLRNNVIHGEVVTGDDIPDVDYSLDGDEYDYLKDIETEVIQATKKQNSEYDYNSDVVINAEDIGVSVDSDQDSTSASAKAGESLGSIFIVGDSAYNYYSFSQSCTDEYVDMVNSFAEGLKGKAELVSMIVPTAIDITLDDATRNSITSSSQKQAIMYMYSRMNSDVRKCYIYDLLRNHREEYIFYRTDHHWTALGAYYAYSAFMSQLGKKAYSLDSFEEANMGAFTGSYYTTTRVSSLGNNPDTLLVYKPFSTNLLQMINHQNDFIDYNIITDVSGWNASSKYSAFIGGDNPYVEIHNPDLSDGSTLLIVKESFGNAFVPFVMENFENVYIVDYRYYTDSVVKLAEEKGADTVLLLNNISVTSTTERVEEMRQICR